VAGETFVLVVDGIDIPENFFSCQGRVDDGLIERFGGLTVTNLTGDVLDVYGFSHLLIVQRDDNPSNPVKDENVLDIGVLLGYLQDILHLIPILGQHRTPQQIFDHLSQMRADILLKVVDHIVSMLDVLDGEENGHGKREQGDQSNDDFETEAFKKFNLFHRWSASLSPSENRLGRQQIYEQPRSNRLMKNVWI
jgi:hypothetical protein